MSNKQRGLLVISILISTLLISACTQSLSSAPVATPTLLPTGLFVSPIPSVANPMAMIEEFAKQTAAAQTSMAKGGTPSASQAVTPGVITPGVIVTSQPGNITTATTPNAPGTPTNAAFTSPNIITTPSGPTATPLPPGVRPTTYTLQSGEFPYCIARRFNVDPDQLLSLSGLTSPDVYLPNQKLTIPQSGAFPGERALKAHPSTYSVLSSDETVYSVACIYGDADPAAIASTNGISVSAKLTAGQQIQIP